MGEGRGKGHERYSQAGILDKNVNVAIFSDPIHMINVKLCKIVRVIKLTH